MNAILSRTVQLFFTWFLLIAIRAIFAPNIQAQGAPPPPSVGARVPTTYFGPMSADVQKELVGPFKLLKAGDVDLKAETVWAGVHFREDMIAGNVIGQEVAEAVLQRVHLDGSPGDRSKRVLGQALATSAFFGDGGPRYH